MGGRIEEDEMEEGVSSQAYRERETDTLLGI